MLWLALYLPRLPLDARPCACSDAAPPRAIVERERIVVADDGAQAAGIVSGLRLASARARLPELVVQPRDPAQESAALTRLACSAGAFTSEVSLAPPATLLLEIAGSLRFFGGVERLFAGIVQAAAEQGLRVQAALAPTPLAAQWLAFAGGADAGFGTPASLDAAPLAHRLGVLPLARLALPAAQEKRLAAFGAGTLADALRLPRAGLARRVGADFVADLARALGEIPDPRARFVFPEHFSQTLELPARSESALALAFAARRLIAALSGWLAARAAGIRECVLDLRCERTTGAPPALMLSLSFAEVTRDAQRIGRVLDERLARLQLPASVESLCLRTAAPEPLAGRAAALFAADGSSARGHAARGAGGTTIAELIERLQACLGEQGVYRLAAHPEHRPENATQRDAPLARQDARGSGVGQHGPRPLWLLPAPQALPEQGGRPQRGGPLRLLAGPERIESGWWDEGEPSAVGDVRRDYFVAVSQRCEWLWIFRSEAGWFLHGLFA
ncbi:Y-family DNA polymerase [Rhodocyclus tenuis]|uniref:Y-family DNA polymerase n=1 Tax=Rhodocyclus tenuis TaxID=1066 RepID=UPI00190850B0|nr:DNA polymerase Y family protein [Rhodocyclus tenuis]MBK1679049.1 hypothetical protein [Rhodocyclus tenuis]